MWRALALAVLLAVQPALAFTSEPPGSSMHDVITAEGAAALGLPDGLLKALQEAVRRPDLREVKVDIRADKVLILDGSGAYEPSHHCDRVPPATDAAAFHATAQFVVQERDQALLFVRGNHSDRAVWWLGYALHALQDCNSHSDIGERDEATQRAYEHAILVGGESPPFVRLTGFQPGAKQADMPPGDSYPHGAFAKDAENATPDASTLLPDGRTKFQAARALAVGETHEFLRQFLENLTPVERAQLFEVRSTTSPAHLGALDGALFLAALAVPALALRRRRRP